MTTVDRLREELADILVAVRGAGLDLVLAGGLGVLLRVQAKQASEERTLADVSRARATTDLDLVVQADLITDKAATETLHAILDARGYRPVAGAENYQFIREAGDLFKVDLHAEEPDSLDGVKADDRRIRPHGYTGLHAHRGVEIIAATEALVEVPLLRDVAVATPNLLTYWVMKLLAVRDRLHDRAKDMGRTHALDMFLLWASTAEAEWRDAQQVGDAYRERVVDLGVGEEAGRLFGTSRSDGTIRLIEAHRREYGSDPVSDDVERFRRDVSELLGAS